MHADVRHENLEDAIDDHNFQKNLGLGEYLTILLCLSNVFLAVTLLPKRLEVAKEECAKQKSNFAQSSMALGPKVRAQWQADIVAWHSQESLPQAQKTVSNPYVCKFKNGK